MFEGLYDNSTADFGGRIAVAIVEWLFILAVLGEFGVAYVALGSVGNGIEETKNWTLFFT